MSSCCSYFTSTTENNCSSGKTFWILLYDPDLTFARVTAAALWKDWNTEPPP